MNYICVPGSSCLLFVCYFSLLCAALYDFIFARSYFFLSAAAVAVAGAVVAVY